MKLKFDLEPEEYATLMLFLMFLIYAVVLYRIFLLKA